MGVDRVLRMMLANGRYVAKHCPTATYFVLSAREDRFGYVTTHVQAYDARPWALRRPGESLWAREELLASA